MDIIMPAIGETVNEGKLAKWFKKTGDQINEGDILCEILKEIIVQENETVAVGAILGIIE